MKKRAPLSKLYHQKVGFQTFITKSASNTWRWVQTLAIKKGGKKQRNKQEVGKCDISSISEIPFIEILASHDCYNFTSTCYQVEIDIQQNQ